VLRHRACARPGHTRGWGGLVTEVLRVNPIACTGHGVCAELLPELISMDPWGYPIVPRAELDDELLDLARKAVAACPVLALTLQKR
jgi:ferredoxin